jgi:hypothetical protein
MSKDRKARNFDFLKNPLPELPSREEVIQKTVELTGQTLVTVAEAPSVSTPVEAKKTKPKEPKAKTAAPKAAKPKPIKQAIVAEPTPKEKGKVGRKALEDTRKPFTSTITSENKRRLRQLCAEYDIAMSDALNELLSAQFEQRPPKFA